MTFLPSAHILKIKILVAREGGSAKEHLSEPTFSFKVSTTILHQHLSLALTGSLETHFNHKVIPTVHPLSVPRPGHLIRVIGERPYCVSDAECDSLTRCVLLSGHRQGHALRSVPVAVGSVSRPPFHRECLPASPTPLSEPFCLLPLSPALIFCWLQLTVTTPLPTPGVLVLISCLFFLPLLPFTQKVTAQVVFSNRITGSPIPHALSTMCHRHALWSLYSLLLNLGKPVATEEAMPRAFPGQAMKGNRVSAWSTGEAHSRNPVTVL